MFSVCVIILFNQLYDTIKKIMTPVADPEKKIILRLQGTGIYNLYNTIKQS